MLYGPCRLVPQYSQTFLALPIGLRRTHNLFMHAGMPDSILTSLYAYLRVWLEQRAKRRESLRVYRLTARAARRLR